MNTDIPLDKRIKNLTAWLDTHPHDEEIKNHGKCKYCAKHVEGLQKRMKQFTVVLWSIMATICIIIGYFIGIEKILEAFGISCAIAGGYYIFRRYVGFGGCF